MKKIAACYIRVSTDDQAEYSPQSQLKEIQRYAQLHDYYIPEQYIFTDEGISGRSTAKRPAFNSMIAAAKKKPKPFEAVLLWKFSRFARNRTDAIVYKNLLRNQCGIDVISISENLGEDRGTAVILESMFEAMDEYYSINLSAEVKRTMQMKAENGEALMPAPFGYKNENKKFIVDPEKAELIKMIFNSYENGEGIRAIARKLSTMGVRTKRGNIPDNRFVDYILRNPFYIGKIRWSDGRQNCAHRYKGEHLQEFFLYQGQHEAIICAEQFDRVQQLLSETAKRYGKYQRKEAPKDFMLKGLVRCNTCGGTLTKSSTATPSLQCHNYSRGKCSTSHYISLNKLNGIIIDALRNAVETLQFTVEVKGDGGSDSVVLGKMLESEKSKLAKVKFAYEEGVDTLEEYKINKARLTASIAEIEKKLSETAKAPTKKAFAKKINGVLEIIDNATATEPEKNLALRTIISKIELIKPGNHIRIYFYA